MTFVVLLGHETGPSAFPDSNEFLPGKPAIQVNKRGFLTVGGFVAIIIACSLASCQDFSTYLRPKDAPWFESLCLSFPGPVQGGVFPYLFFSTRS